MPLVISPAVTQTANGQDLYVPNAGSPGAPVVDSDLTVTGELSAEGGLLVVSDGTVGRDVRIVELGRVAGTVASLSIGGSLTDEQAQTSTPGGANYTLFKTTGPTPGVLQQDALQLFRYGPASAGAQNSQVIGIEAKPGPVVAGVENDMFVGADVTTQGSVIATTGVYTPALYRLGDTLPSIQLFEGLVDGNYYNADRQFFRSVSGTYGCNVTVQGEFVINTASGFGTRASPVALSQDTPTATTNVVGNKVFATLSATAGAGLTATRTFVPPANLVNVCIPNAVLVSGFAGFTSSATYNADGSVTISVPPVLGSITYSIVWI